MRKLSDSCIHYAERDAELASLKAFSNRPCVPQRRACVRTLDEEIAHLHKLEAKLNTERTAAKSAASKKFRKAALHTHPDKVGGDGSAFIALKREAEADAKRARRGTSEYRRDVWEYMLTVQRIGDCRRKGEASKMTPQAEMLQLAN